MLLKYIENGIKDESDGGLSKIRALLDFKICLFTVQKVLPGLVQQDAQREILKMPHFNAA